MSAPTCRPAAIGDAADIHALLLAVAGDIPLAVEALEQQEALYAAVRKMLAVGQSWVAVDGETVIGFVLVDSAEAGRHWGEHELLNLRYVGGEMLDGLIGRVLDRNVPVTASVRDANRSGLAERLKKFGFREMETRVGEQQFRREP